MPAADPSEPPSRYDALVVDARTALARQDAAAAIVPIIDALAIDSRRPAAWNLLGAYRELRGDREQAVRAYRTALDLDATMREAIMNLVRLGAYPHPNVAAPVLG
jgi:Flp pilus assembly protein TadD